MIEVGTTAAGLPVHQIRIGAGDLTAEILTWGAILRAVRLAGIGHSLTLGEGSVADYMGGMRHHGSIIGPVGNRIGGARAAIDGMTYELERNYNGRHTLHSGKDATHLRVWEVDEVTATAATLSTELPDGQCGLPGNRRITARYEIAAPASLTLTLTATTDATTLMNPVNHSYWNLDGTPVWDGHQLRIAAEHWLPGDEDFRPTGEIAAVDGSPMDFRQAREIGHEHDLFDNNFCLSDARTDLRDVLWLRGKSGVGMTLATTEPGVQVYDGRQAQRPGHGPHEGLAIEPQFWPDATSNRRFPSILLKAGQTYRQVSQWRFERDMVL